MKQNIKIFLIALIIGMISSYIICYKFDNSLIVNALNNHVTCFVLGAYTNEEEALAKSQNYNPSTIYNDKGIYKVIIGVYNNKKSIALMSSYFNDKNIKYTIEELDIDSQFINQIKNYEELIVTSQNIYYESLNQEIINVFNEYMQ